MVVILLYKWYFVRTPFSMWFSDGSLFRNFKKFWKWFNPCDQHLALANNCCISGNGKNSKEIWNQKTPLRVILLILFKFFILLIAKPLFFQNLWWLAGESKDRAFKKADRDLSKDTWLTVSSSEKTLILLTHMTWKR